VAAGTAAVFDGKAEALLEAADRALYRAKRDGRNAVADAAGTLCRPHTNVPTAA
jgi:PleD family two-component response regulator